MSKGQSGGFGGCLIIIILILIIGVCIDVVMNLRAVLPGWVVLLMLGVFVIGSITMAFNGKPFNVISIITAGLVILIGFLFASKYDYTEIMNPVFITVLLCDFVVIASNIVLFIQLVKKRKSAKIKNTYLQEVKSTENVLNDLYFEIVDEINTIVDRYENKTVIIHSKERNLFIKTWVAKIIETYNMLPPILRNRIDTNYVYRQSGTFTPEEISDHFNVSGIELGEEGESLVQRELDSFSGRYFYFKNLVIGSNTSNNETAEIDFVVVTNNAVFVIEVKNRGKGKDKTTIVISSDGLWQVKNGYGNVISTWESPVRQNVRHKIFLDELISCNSENNCCSCDIVPVIVIANNDIAISNETNNTVIRISELVNFIESYQSNCKLSDEERDKIIEIIKSNDIHDKKMVKVHDYENEYNAWNQILQYVQNNNKLKETEQTLEEARIKANSL